jgi:hypothetical protein
MNRHFLSVTAASLALSAGVAHAGSFASDEQMMDACIQQYIADNLAGYQGKVTVNKSATGYHPLSLTERTEVVVTAVHRVKGEKLGTVVCKVSHDGKVTVSSPDAAATARLEKLNKSPVIARTAD